METNTITNLKDKPLKYVVTKNKNMIELLKNSGDLIIYEPNSNSINTEWYKENTYRELWVGDYFISGGFGAKSKEELDEFRRSSYSYINLSSQIDELSNKIDMKLDTFGGDLSYTYIPWVNQNSIQGYELYNRIKEIKSQPQLEINSILYKCDFVLPNGVNYSETGNYINVPYNSRLKNLTCMINGSYEYGINTVQIIMNDSIKYNNININNNDTNSNFEITIEIKDIVGPLLRKSILIKEGEINNNIIKSIKITTNKSDDFKEIYKNIYPLYPLTINGISSFIFAYNNTGDAHKLLTNSNINSNDIYNLPITNNYQIYWNDNNEYILNVKNVGNDYVKDISFLLNQNTQIIEAIYVDSTNNYYTSNIIDFLLPIKKIYYNSIGYIQYIINPNLGEKNKQYDPKINPPFLDFHSDNNNQYFTFNQGQIILKVSISNISKYFNQDEINKFKLQYPNQYWISYNEDYYKEKYTYSYTYTYYYSIPYLPI